jgi:hypothetical protein
MFIAYHLYQPNRLNLTSHVLYGYGAKSVISILRMSKKVLKRGLKTFIYDRVQSNATIMLFLFSHIHLFAFVVFYFSTEICVEDIMLKP